MRADPLLPRNSLTCARLLAPRIACLVDVGKHQDICASTIELAIITAIPAGFAAAVLVIISNIVNSRSSRISSNYGRIRGWQWAGRRRSRIRGSGLVR